MQKKFATFLPEKTIIFNNICSIDVFLFATNV